MSILIQIINPLHYKILIHSDGVRNHMKSDGLDASSVFIYTLPISVCINV